MSPDADRVAQMLDLFLHGWALVDSDLAERVTVEDFDAVRSLLMSELDLQRVETVRSLRGFAAAARDFLETHPGWGL